MKNKKIVLALAAAGILAAGGYGLYTSGMNSGMKMAATNAPAAPGAEEGGERGAKADLQTGRKVLYWHDPMVPGHKFDKPGRSPFMDMDLVPVYADEAGDAGTVAINPRVQQNLGIRTAPATKASFTRSIEAVGNVAYNERDLVLVQARSNGFVERLHVRAPLDPVKKGQPLVQLYIPDWIAAQEEYLSVTRMQGAGAETFADAARQRMRLAGMTDAHIRQIERSQKVQPRITLTAPVSGVVAELAVREGMTVMAGAPLFRINGLHTVWVNAEVPESAAALVRPGSTVEATTPSLPGKVFKGKVSALLPEVDPSTRTLKARVELANPGSQLVPGMFASVIFAPATQKQVLTVPTEAIIQTGRRSVVILAQDEGRFMPVDVEIGIESNGQTEIRKGLQEGQKVVVSGQFLIDSEASLKGTTNRMTPVPADDIGSDAGTVHQSRGKVESIDKDEIVLSHEPIPSLNWGEMTMGFQLPAGGLPGNIKVGDTVVFELRAIKDGIYQVVSIAPAGKAVPQGRDKSAGTEKQERGGMKGMPMPGNGMGTAQ